MTTKDRAPRAAGGRKTRGMPLEVAERIRYWMGERGVSWSSLQAQLRERGTSVSESTMSRLLNGKTEPKIGTLGAIADALHVGLRDLLPASPIARQAGRKVASVPTARWEDSGIELNGSRSYLLLDGQLVSASQSLVALETHSTTMEPLVAADDVLIVDVGAEVAEGSQVLIMDPATRSERLMWMHHMDDGGVRYSDLRGYVMGPLELVQGQVVLVIRRTQRLKEPLPEALVEGSCELVSAIAARQHA